MLAEFDEEGAAAVTDAQVFCLSIMFLSGTITTAFVAIFWEDMSQRKRRYILTGLALWLGPPMYFLWTKGVMG